MTPLEVAIARVPTLREREYQATRLAGLTNVNYLVDCGDERFVVRLPGDGTSEYIDRAVESVAAANAARAGVNAPVEYFDPTDGLMVTRYIDGAATMSAEGFQDLAAVARAGIAFRLLHDRSDLFAVDFRLSAMIDEYKALLAAKGAQLPSGYDAAVRRAGEALRVLATQPAALVACHCDPLCENFLDTGDRMYIIEYEYSVNNDPMWDLGDLSVEGEFGREQDAVLLRAYFGGDPPPDQAGRMVAYKALCDVLWTLWGLIQHVNDNPAEDFEAYARRRLTRGFDLMESSAFADALVAIESARS